VVLREHLFKRYGRNVHATGLVDATQSQAADAPILDVPARRAAGPMIGCVMIDGVTPGPHRFDVTSVGEGQLRLNTTTGVGLEEASELWVTTAGAEANVLGLLARLGNRTGLVTCLPDTALGRRVVADYRAAGIDSGAVIWRDHGRVALYFVEQSSPPIPSRVIFDRGDTCFTRLEERDVDWGYLGDARLLHVTGITAALGAGIPKIVARAVEQAHSTGQRVSVDVNYRARLWSAESARAALTPLLDLADVVCCSRRDAGVVFGIEGRSPAVAQALSERFNAATVLVSDGADSVTALHAGAALSAQPPPTTIVDRVGAGDALVGGFLHGYLRDDPELGLRLGVTAAALALTRRGDQVRTALTELTGMSHSLGADIVR
jgi:2-dehydro-3-deoxygluconokinase